MTKHPKFGDRILNTTAGKLNPMRISVFVEVRHIPHGRMNAGSWWRCTDGEGVFLLLNPEHSEILDGGGDA